MRGIDDLLRQRALERGDQTFLVCPGQEFSFREMERRVGCMAAGLAGRGLRPGDRCALLLGNGPHFVTAWWGLMRLGAVMVPVNLRLTAREAAYIINHCGARLALTGPESAPILAELIPLCPGVKAWLTPEDLEDRKSVG